ncbi:MAG: GreA/GreB family elongation factor [Acidobacteriota bacterium]|jgi:transcription elongation GreA/GreB family factor
MAISRDLRNRIEKEDFDSVEEAWLDHLAESPDDLDYFVGVARSLVGAGQDERARFLLEMLDEGLRDQDRWRTRLELLRRAGSLLLEPEDLHPQILETLRALHGETPSFEGFIQAVRLDKAPHDVPKTWEKVDRFRSLVIYDVGRTVWMEGKGAGHVLEVNLELDSLKVQFRSPGSSGSAKPLTVGFRAAPKMLTPLSEDHVLRRKLEEPEALEALAEEQPAELLRVTLESYDRPLEASEIRKALSGVVPDGRWSSWWSTVRKHPQVVAHGTGRHSYSWSASSEHAADAIWSRFEEADPRDKLALLRKEGDRGEDLRRRMAESLADLIGETRDSDPGLAFEIASALERDASGLYEADRAPSPADLVRAAEDPQALLAGIEERSWKESAYRLLRETSEGWPELYTARLGREEDPKVLDLLADSLEDRDPTGLWRFVDATMAQATRNPAAFVWIAERAAEDEALRQRKPLALIQQIFTALADKRFGPYKNRLAPLVDSGGTVPRLLDHLEERQAPKAEETIHRASALEGYQRNALTNALHLRFPDLRSEDDHQVIYSTPAAIEEKRAELQNLVRKEIPANRKAIEEARALGDLRENFEYKSARQRHEYLSSRQAQLERELTLARPIDTTKMDASEVRIGTRVELHDRDGDGATRTITILGPWDSKPEEDVLAYESDLARTLLGKKPGETVEAVGTSWEIRSIRPYDG